MSENELNRAIYNAIREKADRIWERISKDMKEGSYTPLEVYEAVKNCKSQEYVEVCVENFRCKMRDVNVFLFVHQFAKLAKLSDKERGHFIRQAVVEDDVQSSATVCIEGRHKALASMTEDDHLRPMLENVYVDAERGYLVASDGYILGAMRASVRLSSRNKDVAPNLLIHPRYIKRADTLNVIEYKGDNYQCDGSYTHGVWSTGEVNGRSYPKWESVMPMLCSELRYDVGKDGAKQLMKFAKSVLKMPGEYGQKKGNHVLAIYAGCGECTLHVCYNCPEADLHTEIAIPLASESAYSIQVGVMAERIVKVRDVWNGSFWYVDPSRPVMFDSNERDTFIIVPYLLNDKYVETDIIPEDKFTVKWDERYGTKEEYRPNIKPMEKKKETKKEEEKEKEKESGVSIKRIKATVGIHMFPGLLIEQDGISMRIAGNSLYAAISTPQGTLKEEYEAMFDSIDAFIDDDLLAADAPDEEAICRAVTDFMEAVYQMIG